MNFAPGSLVRARGREWVVLPDSNAELLMVRPLGGTDDETTGILRALEQVESATFPPPDPGRLGDDRSCRLLRDAVRLSFRSGAGPFRSFGRLSFEPRPYQLVPLLVALRQDPVRILIADDVGIGKTIEASLVARELHDRGEVRRIAVLCPPHLAEQWQGELRTKFHLDAELVLASTAARLERWIAAGESLFDHHPYVVVSMDFIKSERRRDEFLRHAPELVIVDEAHSCAFGAERGGRHLRHRLVTDLAKDEGRHMILVTATPHSGKSEQFRSLLGFLDPGFASLPDDLSGAANEQARKRLAQHLVQRRRADIRAFLDEATPFPDRESREESYRLSPPYRKLLDQALSWSRESVTEAGADARKRRIRWWSVLALLRALASSPAAAAATLRTRAKTLDATTVEEVDELGRAAVLDLDIEDEPEDQDLAPGAEEEGDSPVRRRLLDMARAAERIELADDPKLQKAVQIVKSLLSEGFSPIVFCRFIPTATHVADTLRQKLPKEVAVEAVTGTLPPSDREDRIGKLGEHPKRVLVATDCLSEGINLQERFDAVVHYDLAWNPTRHEQREGRVDRYGQPRKLVRVVTLYGTDNLIDGFVLNVLIRKHIEIRNRTGVSVPVPTDLAALEEAILKNVLVRDPAEPMQLTLFESDGPRSTLELHAEWERASDREKRSRTVYAQESIKVDDVSKELRAARDAIGSGVDLRRFAFDGLRAHGAVVSGEDRAKVDLKGAPPSLRETLGTDEATLCFAPPAREGDLPLDRTHPFVEGLAGHILSTALDSQLDGVARRAGAVTTRAVTRRTTVLLVRLRFHLVMRHGEREERQLAEEARLLAFAGSPERPEWLADQEGERLLASAPDRNTPSDVARTFVEKVVAALPALRPHIESDARARAEALLEAHRRVRAASRRTGVRYSVEPHLPADLLGIYVYLPVAG